MGEAADGIPRDAGGADSVSVGHYILESRLGSGGMGVVHLAHSASGRRVAVKVVHEQLAADPEFRARFQQEVAAARRVSGAFTAPVVDADADAERPWMATLYVPGPTLAEKVKRDGPFSTAELRQLAAGLAEALRDIHRAGVVHRDLKPSNVLLAEDGPKVIDFGISRAADSDLRTETGKVIGTPPFMAPEQFRSPRDVGPAADVFALGCLLVHAAIGRGPFDADSPYLVAYQVVHDEPDLSEVPAELRPLVARCLAKDPAQRPQPDELMAALRGGHGDSAPYTEPDPAPKQQDTEPHGPRWRRHRARWALVGSAAAVLLAAGAFVTSQELGSRATEAHDARGRAAKDWENGIAVAAASESKMVRAAKCAATATALYCADYGVAAARIDAATGKVQWIRKGPAVRKMEEDWVDAPRLSGGLVQVVRDGTLRALDPRSGRPVWSKDVSMFDGCCTFAGDTVLMTTEDGTVTALDGRTGRQRWTHLFDGHPLPVLGYFGGTLYVTTTSDDGTTTRVTAVRADKGDALWSQRFRGSVLPVGADGDALYLTESDRQLATDTVAVVRYEPGRRRTTRSPLPYSVGGGSVTVRGRMVYLLSANGSLMAVDTRETDQHTTSPWEVQTSVSNPSPATVSGHWLYLSAPDGRLLKVDLRKGELTAQTEPRNDPAGRGMLADQPAPMAVGDRVYGYTPRGTIFSVDAGRLGR
ncbi:serine/threonine protein kinase [Wenjunlia tyrosinilytica]|uniref:Serine/threonine protein kinase n=2 Tax=Wenjunlia tyrosinilytica TaxID=1544741 RepID=A0A917ZQI0_9ACTN|nr:serine/threonine protein kinase [Wenjunlia tyrosinilytica]